MMGYRRTLRHAFSKCSELLNRQIEHRHRCIHKSNIVIGEYTNRTSSASCCAPVAQRLEQQTHNLLVRGSNPCGGTNQLASSSYTWLEDGAIVALRAMGIEDLKSFIPNESARV